MDYLNSASGCERKLRKRHQSAERLVNNSANIRFVAPDAANQNPAYRSIDCAKNFPAPCYNLTCPSGARFMAKFIIGVLVGLVLGASTTAYGAGASQTGTSSGLT